MANTRLITNPNSEVCPDYAENVYDDLVKALMSDARDEAQARAFLSERWEAAHATKAQRWAQERREEQEEEDEQRRATEALRLSEIEKARPALPQLSIGESLEPALDDEMFSDALIDKLRKKEWFALAHCLPQARREERDAARRAGDSGMQYMENINGVPTFVSRNELSLSKKVKDDDHLTALEFGIASNAYCRAMERAGYGLDLIDMMANFFARLSGHRLVELGEWRVVMRYVSIQRRRWLEELRTKNRACDLRVIDELMLRDVEDKFRREDHRRENGQVSVFTQPES